LPDLPWRVAHVRSLGELPAPVGGGLHPAPL